MKKLFLCLTMPFITCLAANQEEITKVEEHKKEEQVTTDECCKPKPCPAPKPCPPRCCPCPKEPICCECYVPSYYDLQCNQGGFVYADFLFWYANESNLSPCFTVQGNSSAITAPGIVGFANFTLNLVEVNYLHTKWDPGFRVALGYNFDRDGWDVEANYTWYHNRKSHTYTVPGFGTVLVGSPSGIFSFFPNNGQMALVDPWINTTIFSAADSNGPFLFDKVTSTWKLNFNQVDLELGRKFWLSKHMDMRVYAGSRGAWFNTKFNNQALSKTASDVYVLNRFIDYFKDRMWGVGLLAGLQPQWHVNRYFFIFSNLDAALLFGKFRVHKKEDYTSFDSTGLQSINYHNNSRGVFNHMQAVLDIALGVRWEDTWCYKVRSSVDVAWENHIWFDDNHRYKINSAHVTTSSGVETVNAISFQNYEEVAGNLIMGGLVIRARVDF